MQLGFEILLVQAASSILIQLCKLLLQLLKLLFVYQLHFFQHELDIFFSQYSSIAIGAVPKAEHLFSTCCFLLGLNHFHFALQQWLCQRKLIT
jgi:uncharacterized membrane protein